jgi:tetratricopeptide (TPR) repeat protein
LIPPVIFALPLGFLGAVFAVQSELGSNDDRSTSRTAAAMLALAAIGGAAGGAVAWLVVLPSGGFAALATLVVVAHLSVALLAMPILNARARLTTGLTAAVVVGAVATISLGRPTVAAVDGNDDVIAVARPLERFFAIGRTHAVRIVEHQGQFIVQADGTALASVPVRGSPPTLDARKWLATLPVTARPNARSMLALGLSGAVMLEGVPSSIQHVDVIEPEAAIVAANRAIAVERVTDPLQRAQIRIVANDPRRALHLSSERYDVIVLPRALVRGPVGSSPLSREQLTVLRDHLVDGGVVVHMLEGVTVSDSIVRSAAATLRGEFEYVRLYEPEAGAMIFLASTAPIEPELQLARSGAPITSEIMHYSSMGMNGVEDLLAALVADETGIEALVEGIAAHSDNGWGGFRDDRQANADAVDASIVAADPLRRPDSWVYSNLDDVANFGYLTRRLVTQGRQARAVAASEAHPDESTRLTMVGLLHQSRGQPEQAIAAFRAALDRRPDNVEARYLLIQPNIAAIAQNIASQHSLELIQGLPGSAAAMIAARRASGAGDWATVADLDGNLGAASVTDAWYPGAVLLRADWRSRVDQNVEQLVFDALRLIDRVLLIEPDRNFYLLRASIGIGADDGNIAVESSRNIVRLTAQIIQNATATGGQIESQQVEMIRQNLNVIVANLRGDLVAANRRRAEEVRQAASLILRYLDTALSEEPQ